MGVQPEIINYDTTVYEYELTDPVQGGVGGVANAPLLSLSNRTGWLKQQLSLLQNGTVIPPTVAPLNGPAFTGSTTAPNVAAGDNSQRIANTNFVQTAISGLAVIAVGGNANVTLTQPQWGVGLLRFTGVLTGNIAVIFPAQTGAWIVANATTGAYSLTCKTAAGAGVIIPQDMPYAGIWGDGTNIYRQNSLYNLSPGTYTAATVTVAADGHITAIAAGSPTGRLLKITAYTVSTVYVPTAGMTSAIFEGVGGGGGGSGAIAAGAGNCCAAPPGNAGSWGRGQFTAAQIGGGFTVSIGAAGAAGSGGSGGNGGNTSFGALMLLPGGPGGVVGLAQSGSASGGNGLSSGTPTGANIGSGLGGIAAPSFGFLAGQVAVGGAGGQSFYGAGGVGTPANLPGFNAPSFGSGGGGTFGSGNTLSLVGGLGAAGFGLIYEYA